MKLRVRRRSRTAITRHQTDRLAGHTYVDAAARTDPTVTTNISDAAGATNATNDSSISTRANENATRYDRDRRRR